MPDPFPSSFIKNIVDELRQEVKAELRSEIRSAMIGLSVHPLPVVPTKWTRSAKQKLDAETERVLAQPIAKAPRTPRPFAHGTATGYKRCQENDGKPCGVCVQGHNEYARQYRLAHPEQTKAIQQRWAAKHEPRPWVLKRPNPAGPVESVAEYINRGGQVTVVPEGDSRGFHLATTAQKTRS